MDSTLFFKSDDDNYWCKEKTQVNHLFICKFNVYFISNFIQQVKKETVFVPYHQLQKRRKNAIHCPNCPKVCKQSIKAPFYNFSVQ